MSFTFDQIDTSQISKCAQDPVATIVGVPFLKTYFQPGIRAGVLHNLAAMRDSGFSSIELQIEFAKGNDTDDRVFNVATDGAEAVQALAAYAHDVSSIGFTHLYIEYIPEGVLSPTCTVWPSQNWGECFEPTTIRQSIAFVTRLRAALRDQPGIDSDLAPAMCTTPATPAQLRSNVDLYTSQMVAGYLKRFSQDSTTVSCQAEFFGRGGKDSVDRAYQTVNQEPSFYAVLVYPVSNISSGLEETATALNGNSKRLMINEITYGTPSLQEQAITTLAPVGLDAVYFWPLSNLADGCGIDVAPPYTLDSATSGN